MPDPDEAQQTEEPPRQRSTQPSARQMAEKIASQLDGLNDAVARLDKLVYDHIKQYEDDHIRESVRTHANQITGLRDELTGFQNGITRQLDKMREAVAGVGPIMDGAAGTLAGDFQASMDRTATKVSEVLARLEALERRTTNVEAAGGTVDTAPLFERLDAVERQIANPPKFTLDSEQAGRIIERAASIARAGTLTDDQLISGPAVGGVHAKVLELMRKVNAIGKDREANQGAGGRFKFRGIDEAMDAVGHAMREVGLTMETEMLGKDYAHNPVTNTFKDGGQEKQRTVLWTTATVTYRYIFVDPVDGSRHAFEMAGEGRDASDKATSKAGSMALKYGLLQALMVPVKGLDDGDAESPQVHQDRPAQPPAAQQSGQKRREPQAQPQGQQQAPQKPKAERARDAVTAVRNINRWPAEERLDRLVAISSRVEQEGLGAIEVDGATVRAHLIATQNTLAPAPEPPDDQPPF
jgi:outer membrane murein-binding lipoprotein Lpp